MRSTTALLLLLCTAPAAAQSLLIEGGRIVDPVRATVGPATDILVVDGRIASIGRQTKLADGVRVVPAHGRFVMPGLIDSHVHAGHIGILNDELAESRPDLVRAYRQQVPRTYLYFGFTTLIDPDLRPGLAETFASRDDAPSLLGCGRGIRLMNGYGPAFVPPARRLAAFPNWVFDANQEQALPDGIDRAAHTATGAVDAARRDGAIAIKTYFEPGFGGVFDWPVPSPELLAGIVTQAHRHDLPVMLHATSLDGYRAGLRAGVDVLAHGAWHWPGVDLLVSEPPAALDEIAREIAMRKIAVQPTMRVILGENETLTDSILAQPHLRDALPAPIVAWLATDEGHWAQRELVELRNARLPQPGPPLARYLDSFDARIRNVVRTLVKNRVPLIFGSDTPGGDGPANTPGLNGLLEIQAWAGAGVTLPRLLAALTIDNARRFHLDHDRGSVEVGKRADLLVLGADPTRQLAAYDRIEWVVAGGRVHAREALSARHAPPP